MIQKNPLATTTFLFPALALVAVFVVYPVGYSIVVSFQRYNLAKLSGSFIGLQNYVYLFKTGELPGALLRGFIWMFGTLAGQMILGVAFALVLKQRFAARGLVRAIVVLPFFLPGVSLALTWRWMYYDYNGIINFILLRLGIISEPMLWLSSTNLAMISVIIFGVWRFTPFVVINTLARLSTISRSLYEAAYVDGAGPIRCFFSITLPQLRSVLLVVVLLRGIWMFNKFAEIHLLTGGGPAGATTTLPIIAYYKAFGDMRVGEASAINTVIFVILLIIGTVYIRTLDPAKEIGS